MAFFQIYTHPSGLKHDTGAGHPESPARLQTLLDLFREKPFDQIPVITAPQAERAWLARAHDRAYINHVEDSMPYRGYDTLDGGDTIICPDSWEAALTAVGAVCQAVDDILSGTCTRAFCAVRPPGHHAGIAQAEGFCLFNNIVIGALHALAAQKINRVAILDFDVHHGNGTDQIARKHDNIFFASTHQAHIYPNSGYAEHDIEGRIINRPLPYGTDGSAFRSVWTNDIFPALDRFAPELIFISAGFDGHKNDPLATLGLVENDFALITREITKLADKHAQGRIVSVLEGGYNLTALKNSVKTHLEMLVNEI